MIDKTMTDVADDVVNHVANGMQKLSDGLTSVAQSAAKIAPDAWKILVHQQKTLAIQDIIIGLMLFVGLIVGLFVYKKFAYNGFAKLIEKDSDFMAGQITIGVIVVAISIVTMCFSVSHLTDGYVRYSSAEYYAAQDALGMVKK
jgi:hypothetical protein